MLSTLKRLGRVAQRLHRQRSRRAGRRILLVANALIPTLQLRFITPLAALQRRGEVELRQAYEDRRYRVSATMDLGCGCRYEAGELYSGEFASNAAGREPPVLRTVVNKSCRALLRYVPPQVSRHLPAPFKGPAPIPGPPPGISIETLDALCAEQLGGRIRRCAHQHVAGWKTHGTFRLYVVAETGIKRTFIFKDEIYTIDENPALGGLCVLPGPPEHHVYAQSVNTALSHFLPELFRSAEIAPSRHFRYLLEDLRVRYRRLHFNRRDLLFAVRALIEVHKAMKLTLAREKDHNLIHYDGAYSERLLEYCRSSLEQYSGRTGDEEVREIIPLWPNIVKHHKGGERYSSELNQPVHGDYTLAHIHWKNGVDGVKIVDWEWAEIGLPHADLAAILKWADPALKREAINILQANTTSSAWRSTLVYCAGVC